MFKFFVLLLCFLFVLNKSTDKIIDKTKFLNYKNLKKIKEIKLKENDDELLITISMISLNSDESNLLITDKSSQIIFLYDAKNGNCIRTFSYSFDYIDSLTIKAKPFAGRDNWFKPYDYKNEEDWLKFTNYKQFLKGGFGYAIFLNDSIIAATCSIKGFLKLSDTNFFDSPTIIGGNVALIKFKSSDFKTYYSKEIIPLESNKLGFPQNYFFVYNKNYKEILNVFTNFAAESRGNFDSLAILALFDEYGNFKKIVMHLPDDYLETKINYSYDFTPCCVINNDNEYICVFPLCDKIYNLSNNTSIKLKNLNYSNNPIIKKLISNPNLLKVIGDSLVYKIPIIVSNICIKEKDKYIIHMTKLKNNNSEVYRIIQEYNKSGDLIKECIIPNYNEDGFIHHITYSNIYHSLIIARKSNSMGWSIAWLKWD